MVDFFKSRDYPNEIIQEALERASATSRESALTPQSKADKDDRPILALTYHPHNLPVKNVLLRNFHLLQQDPTLGHIFKKPPLVAYRRDTNMGDTLVHATFNKDDNTDQNLCGNKPCGTPGCHTCPYIDTSTVFTGPTGNFSISRQFSCKSSNIVYILTCYRCNKMYVGETYRPLNERFKEHERSARLQTDNPVGQHFKSAPHNLKTDLRIAAIWSTSREGAYRKHFESKMILSLGTKQPHGMNVKR